MQEEGSQSVPPLTPPHLLHQGLQDRHRIGFRVCPLVRGAALHAFEVCRLATWGTILQTRDTNPHGANIMDCKTESEACAILHLLEQLRQYLTECVAGHAGLGLSNTLIKSR